MFVFCRCVVLLVVSRFVLCVCRIYIQLSCSCVCVCRFVGFSFEQVQIVV